ncbi:hypothetical protein PCASD_03952 [Puccinia coronata f. sp. avenae]|uniref:Mitotic checkpoint regulator, MAD2B-interacting-domain-containing protein n=1 Tax=Puccinia coronata f. sp. avenae TaxID=200324 RepID=A0A2N5VAR4_9BASI|nr:hypothetical protein PCASD_03952 [Puccinia coronata f. sp. avenae]
MGLVDYQGSSDEDAERPAARPPPPKKLKPTKARILIQPAPSISAEQESQSKGNTTTNDHTEKGDLLDILKRKKPGADAPSKSSGLASLLPPPKRTQPSSTSTSSSSSLSLSGPSSSLGLKPKVLAPIKRDPAPPPASSEPIASSSTTTLLNLFGLAPPSVSERPPETTSMGVGGAALPGGSSLTVSSAPQVEEEAPPPPSLLDPYPGYWQRKDGSWCARDADDAEWAQFYRQHYAPSATSHDADPSGHGNALPKDFFKDAPAQLPQFDSKLAAKNAWENRPKIVDPREEARLEQLASAKPAKHISSRARGRHQLTSLLTDAQANRVELEERISRGKLNRKTGGAKYGF